MYADKTGTPKFRGSGCQFPQSQCHPSPRTGIALGTRLDTSTSRSAFARNVEVLLVYIFQVVVSLSIRAFVHISPRIFSCFQLISVKKYQIFDEKFLFSKYFVYILQQLPSMRTTYPNLRTGTLWERNWHAESCRHDVSCCIGLIKLLFVVSNDNYGDLCENLL